MCVSPTRHDPSLPYSNALVLVAASRRFKKKVVISSVFMESDAKKLVQLYGVHESEDRLFPSVKD
jgi:hypothetical protein